MARFIEIENIWGHKTFINIDFIQSIKEITNDSTCGNTCIILSNDRIQTNLAYSKVIELIKPEKKGSDYGSN